MKVIFFGGTAFAGKLATSSLVNEGHSVTVVSRRANPNKQNIDLRHCLLTVPSETLPTELNEIYDVSIDTLSIEPEIAKWILSNSRAQHRVYISSMSVYNYIGQAPFNTQAEINRNTFSEFTPNTPAEVYAYNKLASEVTYLEQTNTALSIIRPPVVIGQNDPTNRFQRFIQNILTKKVMPIIKNSKFQIAFATELASAICDIATTPSHKQKIVNFAHPRIWSQEEFLLAIGEILNTKIHLKYVELETEHMLLNPYLRLVNHFFYDQYAYSEQPAEQLLREAMVGL